MRRVLGICTAIAALGLTAPAAQAAAPRCELPKGWYVATSQAQYDASLEVAILQMHLNALLAGPTQAGIQRFAEQRVESVPYVAAAAQRFVTTMGASGTPTCSTR